MSSVRRSSEEIELAILQSLSTHQQTPISYVTLKAKISYAHLERTLENLQRYGFVVITEVSEFMGDSRISKVCLLTEKGAARARWLEETLSIAVKVQAA
jgi:predicted transcriptional regulator